MQLDSDMLQVRVALITPEYWIKLSKSVECTVSITTSIAIDTRHKAVRKVDLT